MPIPIVVPRLGWTMEQGVFVEWLKRDGDYVRMGDSVFVLEGEKATQDIESTDSGILKIPAKSPKSGDIIAVGSTVGYLLAAGEAWQEDADEPEAAPEAQLEAAAVIPELVTAVQFEARINPGRSEIESTPSPEMPQAEATISPRALRVARELGVDWTQVQGTGSTGRIRESDIRAAAATRISVSEKFSIEADESLVPQADVVPAVCVPETIVVKPAPGIRRIIAERMLASAQTTAGVTITTRLDATHLVSLRKQFQSAATTDDVVPSYTDILVKLAAIALKQHPVLNSTLDEQFNIIQNDEAHIGIAVDTPSALLVPVLRSVGRLTLRQVAIRTRELIERARQRTLSAFEMHGGTFTITNMGMFGVDTFTPLLNLPQAAILGVGRITREPAVINDQIVPRDRLTLSLTFDHRILDGAPAARFLDTLSSLIANPAPALIT